MYVYMHALTCMYMYMHALCTIHVHACTHIHTNLYIYTYTYTVPEDDIHNYISVFGLRTYGELNGKPVKIEKLMTPLSMFGDYPFSPSAVGIRDCVRAQ